MSDDYIVPCENPANDPEDWFIGKDGRQYPDDVVIDEQAVADRALAEHGDGEGIFEAVDTALDAATQEALNAALVRRRHAKDKCHVECYFRTQCLTIALTKPEPPYGTWGGYYEEELKVIRRVRDEKTREAEEAESHNADVVAEE